MMYCLDLKLIHIIHWICTESEKITLNNSVDSFFLSSVYVEEVGFINFFFFRFFVLVQGNVVFSDKYISKIIIFTPKKKIIQNLNTI